MLTQLDAFALKDARFWIYSNSCFKKQRNEVL